MALATPVHRQSSGIFLSNIIWNAVKSDGHVRASPFAFSAIFLTATLNPASGFASIYNQVQSIGHHARDLAKAD
jgi:hypothetical protein